MKDKITIEIPFDLAKRLKEGHISSCDIDVIISLIPPLPDHESIYIVQGGTGEYEDHEEWPVKAFKSEKEASDYTTRCNKEAEELILRSDKERCSKGVIKHSLDPNFRWDRGGIEYEYYSVEIEI